MKIRKDDIVRVTAGKDKGKEGKVLRVYPEEQKVLVEHVNIAIRHIKKQGTTPGQKVSVEKPLHVSNVAFIDPVEKKPTRIGYSVEKGHKVRIAKKSGKAI